LTIKDRSQLQDSFKVGKNFKQLSKTVQDSNSKAPKMECKIMGFQNNVFLAKTIEE